MPTKTDETPNHTVWKSEDHVRTLAVKCSVQVPFVEHVGREFFGKEDGADDAKDHVRAIGKLLQSLPAEKAQELQEEAISTPLDSPTMLTKTKHAVKAHKDAAKNFADPVSESVGRGAAPPQTTAPHAAEALELPREAVETLRLDFIITPSPSLVLPITMRGEYQTMLKDAYRRHADRIVAQLKKCADAVNKVNGDATRPEDATAVVDDDDNNKENTVVSMHRHQVVELVKQLADFCTLPATMPNNDEGRAIIKRECRRLEQHLPALMCRPELSAFLADPSQKSLVVTGATGSGKSTQLPQYVAEHLVLQQLKTGGKRQLIICTQPRRMAARSLADRVRDEWMDSDEVGYDVGADFDRSPKNRIRFMTEFSFLRFLSLQPVPPGDLAAVIVDEAHERSIQCDIILGRLKCLIRDVPEWSHVRLIVTSATIDTSLFRNFLAIDANKSEEAPLVEIPGRTFPVRIDYADNDIDADAENVDAAVTKVQAVLREIKTGETPDGDILCFMPSAEEASNAAAELTDRLDAKMEKQEGESNGVVPKRGKEVEVVELSGRLSLAEQTAVLKPSAKTRAIFCTMVAETSITISSVKYVVDVGLARRPVYDHRRNLTELAVLPISKQSADQRTGRAGRTSPGICFRLYSEEQYLAMSIGRTCDLLSQPLETACLQLISLGLPVDGFDWVEPPSPESVKRAMASLQELNAIAQAEDGSPQLTQFGRFAREVRLELKLAFIVFHACRDKNKNLGAAAVGLVSVMSVLSFWWWRPQSEIERCREVQRELAASEKAQHGDAIHAALQLAEYLQLPRKSSGEDSSETRGQFGERQCISRTALWKAERQYDDLRRALAATRAISATLPNAYQLRLEDRELLTSLKRLVISAFASQVAVRVHRVYYQCVESTEEAKLHGSSLMPYRYEAQPDGLPDVVIFTELFQTTRVFVKGITPLAVSELPPKYQPIVQHAIDNRPAYFEVPAPTLLLRRLWGRDIEQECLSAIDPNGRVFNVLDPGLFRVRVANRHKDRAQAAIEAHIQAKEQDVCCTPVEHPLVGACRLLLGEGGNVVDVLKAREDFMSVRVTDFRLNPTMSTRSQIVEAMRQMPNARAYQNLSVGKQAHDSFATFWLHFRTCDEARAALNELKAANFDAFSSFRKTDCCPAPQRPRTEFRFRITLAADPENPEARIALPDYAVQNVREAVERLFPFGTNTYGSYDANRGILTFNAVTDEPTARLLTVAARSVDTTAYGVQAIRTYYDYAVRVPIPSVREVVNEIIRSCFADAPKTLFYNNVWPQQVLHLRSRNKHEVQKYARTVAERAIGEELPWPQGVKADVLKSERGQEIVFKGKSEDGLVLTNRPVTMDCDRRSLRFHGRTEEFEAFREEIDEFLEEWVTKVGVVKETLLPNPSQPGMPIKKLNKKLKGISKKHASRLPSALQFTNGRCVAVAPPDVIEEIVKACSLIQEDDVPEPPEHIDASICSVCFSPLLDAYTLRCGHRFCRGCIIHFLEQPVPLLPLVCPNPDCGKTLSMQDIKFVAPQAVQNIAEFARNSVLEAAEGSFGGRQFMGCVTKACQGLVEDRVGDDVGHGTLASTFCSGCRTEFCGSCAKKFNAVVDPHSGECVNPNDKLFDNLKTKLLDLFENRCPRCDAVFFDFDGCFSVTCDHCPCRFCGFCMKDCGTDAHAHALRCPRGDGDIFASVETFHRLREEDKRAAAQTFIAEAPPQYRRRLTLVANSLFDYVQHFVVPEESEQPSVSLDALSHQLDDMFENRCPRCHAVFCKFDGCFAVKCGHCPCGFCGFCMEDCGADAHDHLPACPRSRNDVEDGDPKRLFAKLREEDKRKAVEKFLRTQVPEKFRKKLTRRANGRFEHVTPFEISSDSSSDEDDEEEESAAPVVAGPAMLGRVDTKGVVLPAEMSQRVNDLVAVLQSLR